MPVNDQTPHVIIMDSTDTLLEVSGGVGVPTGTKGLLFAGVQPNGSASFIQTDTSGNLRVGVINTAGVQLAVNSGSIIPADQPGIVAIHRNVTDGRAVIPSTEPDGTLRSGLYDYDLGSRFRIFENQDLGVAERQILNHDSHTYEGVDLFLWSTSSFGSATITQTSGELLLQTNTTANSTASMQSTTVGRFVAGTSNAYLVGARVSPTTGSNNIRRWGVFTTDTGYFFELSGSDFYSVIRKSGTDTKISSSNWNIQTYNLDSNYHRYEILYFGNTVTFVVDTAAKQRYGGQVSSPRTNILSFPMRMENVNSGGGIDNTTVAFRGTSISRFGPFDIKPRCHNINTTGIFVLKKTTATLHRIVINKTGNGLATLVVYDNITNSGTTVASLDITDTLQVLEYHCDTSVGLTIAITSGTGFDVTIIYD